MFVSVLSSTSVFAFPIASDVDLYGTYEMEDYCQDVTIMTDADTNKLENKVESDRVECLKLPNIKESFNGVAKRPSCGFDKGSKLNQEFPTYMLKHI